MTQDDQAPTPGQGIYSRGYLDALRKIQTLIEGLIEEIEKPWETTYAGSSKPSIIEIENEPIEILGINNHAINILKRNKITTVGQLLEFNDNQILELEGIGPVTMADIEYNLNRHHLALGRR